LAASPFLNRINCAANDAKPPEALQNPTIMDSCDKLKKNIKTLKIIRKPQHTQYQQHINLSEGCVPFSQQHIENQQKATTHTKPAICKFIRGMRPVQPVRKPQPTQNQQHVNLSEGCIPSSQSSQEHIENHSKTATHTKPTICKFIRGMRPVQPAPSKDSATGPLCRPSKSPTTHHHQ
jgi:hypothetical protein